MWTRATAPSGLLEWGGEAAAARARCLRRKARVSADLRAERVVGRTTRCELEEWVAKKMSMRRSQMPRPTPLGVWWWSIFIGRFILYSPILTHVGNWLIRTCLRP